jgi:hypothetical protein
MNNSLSIKLDNILNRLRIMSERQNTSLDTLLKIELENLQDVSDRLLLKELSE